jgi:5-methylcytosine-specific restriction protein A
MAKLKMLGPRIPTADTRRVKPPPKTAEAWYLTPEHRAWAAEVIRRSGNRCQDQTCKARHWPGQRLFADHIKERRDRPDLALDVTNGQALCGSAHTRKTIEERAKRMRG